MGIGYDDAKDSTAFPQPAGYSLLSFLVYHNFLKMSSILRKNLLSPQSAVLDKAEELCYTFIVLY